MVGTNFYLPTLLKVRIVVYGFCKPQFTSIFVTPLTNKLSVNPWHPIDHFDLRNGPFLKLRPRLEPLSLLSFRWDLSDYYYFYKWYVLLNFAHEEIAYCYYLFCNAFLKVSKSRKIALSYRLAAHPSIILCETFATSGLNKALSKIICKTAMPSKRKYWKSFIFLL